MYDLYSTILTRHAETDKQTDRQTETSICLVQVQLGTEVLRTRSSTQPGFELNTPRSWQYTLCYWYTFSNHQAISDFWQTDKQKHIYIVFNCVCLYIYRQTQLNTSPHVTVSQLSITWLNCWYFNQLPGVTAVFIVKWAFSLFSCILSLVWKVWFSLSITSVP